MKLKWLLVLICSNTRAPVTRYPSDKINKWGIQDSNLDPYLLHAMFLPIEIHCIIKK